jgi:hypothetical protein
LSAGRLADFVVPAWSVETEPGMDVSGQILRTLMPAIHIGMMVSQKFRAEVKPT